MNKPNLPISDIDGFYLDQDEAKKIGLKLRQEYLVNIPYPHVVIDNFLPEKIAKKLLESFPTYNCKNDVNFERKWGGLHKRQISPNDTNSYARSFFSFLNSAPIIQFLEGLTGIEGLLPDPYFNGGGFHETSNGGKLDIHADFRINQKLHLLRRVNLLIYLNRGWNDEFGGALELYDRKMKSKIKSVAPTFNRCVIFNTDSDSFHGHPTPLNLPDGLTRKSIALYYYTASQEIYRDMPAHSTMYMPSTHHPIEAKMVMLWLRFKNHIKDLTPPKLLRLVMRFFRK